MDGEAIPALLAASCSRSSLHPEAFAAVRAAFPECKLVRLSFGLQNKVMLSVTVNLEAEGLIHASYVPIHPTAAAAAVLQNNPVVVVRQDKRSPLWDQEDMYQREGCGTVNAVSMPFYWPPAANTQFEGAALPIPQNPAYHPTFGAMTVGSPRPLTQQSLALLVDLAGRTGRHVGPYISMLLSSLEAAGLLPSESEAQEELGSLLEEELQAAEDDGGPSMDELFTGDDAQAEAQADALIPGLKAAATPVGSFPSLPQQQRRAAHNMALAEAPDDDGALQQVIPDWLLHQDRAPGAEEEAGPAGPWGTPAATPAEAAARLQALRERGPLTAEEQLAEEVRAAGAEPPVTLAQHRQAQPPEPPMPVLWQPPAAPRELQQQPPAVPPPQPPLQQQPSAAAAAPATGPLAAAAWPAAAARLAAASRPVAPARRRQHAVSASGQTSGSGSSGAATPHSQQPATHGFALALLLPWRNVAFQPMGVERTFAVHHSKLQERTDLTAVLLLGLGLLAAAAARMQGAWSAGVAALLLFTPYFFDLRLYHTLREMLLSAAQFFVAYFLYSLHPAAPPMHGMPLGPTSTCPTHLLPHPAADMVDGGGSAAAAGACSAAAAAAAAAPAGDTANLAGFGIVWFIFHTCGLHFLLVAPLLLRLRSSRALPVQSACLALALSHLPVAYTGALGELDTVHVLLLGLLCILAAMAGLTIAQAVEIRQRHAWLQRRLQRAADTLEASGGAVPHDELPEEEEEQ